jgi:hypothetical protein
MSRIEIKQLKYDLTPVAGLTLVEHHWVGPAKLVSAHPSGESGFCSDACRAASSRPEHCLES